MRIHFVVLLALMCASMAGCPVSQDSNQDVFVDVDVLLPGDAGGGNGNVDGGDGGGDDGGTTGFPTSQSELDDYVVAALHCPSWLKAETPDGDELVAAAEAAGHEIYVTWVVNGVRVGERLRSGVVVGDLLDNGQYDAPHPLHGVATLTVLVHPNGGNQYWTVDKAIKIDCP